jgi:hypothetical protein
MLKRLRKRHSERMVKTKDKTLEKLKEIKIAYIPYNELLKEGFFAGLGWAFGVTVGFVIISTILVFILKNIISLPVVGGWFADIVQATLDQLAKRTPIYR